MRIAKAFVVSLVLLGVAGAASAQEFTVDASRRAPYKNYKFRVQWDGRQIPGVVMVSPIHRTTQAVRMRESGGGGIERISPGATTFEPITLIRGRTHDTSFEEWADKVYDYGALIGARMSLANYRKDIAVDVMNEAGQLVLRYLVYRCWPSDYEPISGLDSGRPETLLETLVLQCEGFQRDRDVLEPMPPSR